YARPASYRSDSLINNEIGIRSSLLNHRMLLNASAYTMRWNDIQWLVYDPVNLGPAIYVANGPNYNIKGVELQLVARLTQALTLGGSSSWNLSQQTHSPCLKSAGRTPATPNNPTPADQCITVVNGTPYTNPWGETGSSLPYSPRLRFNVRARYEW